MSDNNESKAKKAKDSKAFNKAKSKAEDYVGNPEKLNELIDNASIKANNKKGPLNAVWKQLMACFRLIKAYAKGSYREISWTSLVMIVASVIYFVMPVDLIPDFILFSGFLDDAALLGWTVKTFSSDIDAFVKWESNNED
ncbi:MAG: uncharacterized membrane protein YkvA (DUF1232 family) [Oleispira sp.]|jgi:uncharacterized membrane protein YkvA (DUF1232 family)